MPARHFGLAAVPLWYVATFVPMVASQIVRLGQTPPFAWLASDWAGRLAALAVLWIIPAARDIAFSKHRRRIGAVEALLWVIGLTGFYLLIDHPVRALIDSALPGTVVGRYPPSQGWLHAVDVTFGLALVAYQEELVFRRCGRIVFGAWLGDGFGMVLATSILFAGYHWWTGIGNMVTTLLFGIGAMWLYRRAGVLWPVVLSHYLVDLAAFA
jgi:hypothetical protein